MPLDEPTAAASPARTEGFWKRKGLFESIRVDLRQMMVKCDEIAKGLDALDEEMGDTWTPSTQAK